jgi:hypothetical protein
VSCSRLLSAPACPEGCTAEFEGFPGSSAVAMSEDNPFVKATARGLAEEWGKPHRSSRASGGSIPLAKQFRDMLGIDCIVIGFILPDDAIHAPDERYDVERFTRVCAAGSASLRKSAKERPCPAKSARTGVQRPFHKFFPTLVGQYRIGYRNLGSAICSRFAVADDILSAIDLGIFLALRLAGFLAGRSGLPV